MSRNKCSFVDKVKTAQIAVFLCGYLCCSKNYTYIFDMKRYKLHKNLFICLMWLWGIIFCFDYNFLVFFCFFEFIAKTN